jgi:streptomycin 6-kinase
MLLPPAFIHTLHGLYPDRAEAWLAELRARIARLEQRWGLQVAAPFPNLSYNFVAPAQRADGTAVVLKLGVPNPELLTEIAALRHYDGHGMARLLEADADEGALLLERLLPGTLLASLADDDEATRIAGQVMRQLWRPVPLAHKFPTVARWGAGFQRLRARFGGGSGPLPPGLVDRAEALFAALLASSAAPVLLHGDLHHDNILAAQRAPWLALDPKGVVGEPAYEVGALMRNPSPQPAAVLARRADILSEILGFDRDRLLAWSLAQAVLSAWWSVEDTGEGWEGAIVVARALEELL